MYSRELEELIESVLADGVLTDKERTVLRKRAQACGEDPDEVIVVVEGRLTKVNKQPTNEKRGNVVKCPNCGATVEGGAVKCTECGYVFTNVKANDTANQFAKELDMKISAVKYDSDKAKVVEFIINYPLPSGKEEMIEFIAGMNARRRTNSDYQKAYNTKYNECVTKAKVQFAGDPQVAAMLKETNKFSLSTFTKSEIRKYCTIIVILIVAIFTVFSRVQRNKEYKVLSYEAQVQCDSLCPLIDKLEMPTKANFKEVEHELLNIVWHDVHSTFWQGFFDNEPGQQYKESFLAKKRSVAEQIYSLYKEVYNDKAYSLAPDAIRDPRFHMDN